MRTLRNWTAKRAGGRITVYGQDEHGAATKVVGVDSITSTGVGSRAYCFAVAKDGEQVKLHVG